MNKLVRESINKKETTLISAFPGVGKSYLFKTNKNKVILDSDSSKFDKKHFPDNYIQHIKKNIGKADIICISSHKEVRDTLVENQLFFTLVYPERSLKKEYVERYKERGNDDNFVKLLEKNWGSWMDELENQKGCKHVRLKSGEYLSDKIN